MKKINYVSQTTVIFDNSHKGAPYTVDGVKWYNRGEICECFESERQGFGFYKDANTRFDKGSDVGVTSVKSARARLTTMHLATEHMQFIQEYMRLEKSERFVWVILTGSNSITAYEMSRTEFYEFATLFTKWDKTPRFTADTRNLIQWLEERA